jgi:hypothetical protein
VKGSETISTHYHPSSPCLSKSIDQLIHGCAVATTMPSDYSMVTGVLVVGRIVMGSPPTFSHPSPDSFAERLWGTLSNQVEDEVVVSLCGDPMPVINNDLRRNALAHFANDLFITISGAKFVLLPGLLDKRDARRLEKGVLHQVHNNEKWIIIAIQDIMTEVQSSSADIGNNVCRYLFATRTHSRGSHTQDPPEMILPMIPQSADRLSRGACKSNALLQR